MLPIYLYNTEYIYAQGMWEVTWKEIAGMKIKDAFINEKLPLPI